MDLRPAFIRLFPILLLGCNETLPFETVPATLTLEAYSSNGELISSRALPASDPVYGKLRELLTREKNGWQKSFVSYKTGPYILRSPDVTIRCYPDLLVIDYVEAGSPKSISKQVPRVLNTLGLPERFDRT